MNIDIPANDGGDHADNFSVLFLIGCAAMLDAKVIVEAGTYKGVFAGSLARAFPEATVYTCDPEDYGVTFPANVRYFKGRFEDMLKEIPGGIDLAFIDASNPKTAECPRLQYMVLALTRLRAGGIVAVDDTAAVDWPYVNTIRSMGHLVFPGHHGLTVIQKR